jgi:hypothetical protein
MVINTASPSPTWYRGCPIYVRQFEETFEYITVIRGLVWTAHQTIAYPRNRSGRVTRGFSPQDIANGFQLMRRMAMATIDVGKPRRMQWITKLLPNRNQKINGKR